ncbi:2-hydroxyacid dehydrogenase [Glutamicibacter mishrai]|uniref:2-hydroxyacid dehydrogenase n=1 Tax=Glutamicibacter mishrai TaxID=1775880 RepID=A0A6H0SJJ9_9MICC|nr:2-hydroxyacid dehydrogenase [Glutamicibacter mishrai]QIV86589.1 2-hydroxyacid dehydrogenase [Glutamicibacter mishrai]
MPTQTSAAAQEQSTPITGEQILRVGPVNPTVAESLKEEFATLVLPDSSAERAALLASHGEQIRVAVCSGRFGVDSELMAQLPNLEAIINFGVGYDATDTQQAAERGIAISNTPDVLNDCVADTALGLYLSTLRSLGAAERFVRDGSWASGQNFPLATRASGKKVGILGLGRIGQAIATRLEAFGCEIHYHNRNQKPEVSYQYHSSAAQLAAETEVLIVAAAGGPQSAKLVNREVLSAVGPQGFIINIARGTVIDEQALVQALLSGEIAGAGLDVFENEPNAPSELLELDNVVLLPHLGSGTRETRADMASLTLENLRAYLTERKLITPIS